MVNKEHFETTNCIVCEADNTEKISEKGQFGFPAHVVICRECGLSYLNPRWNQARLNQFYENEYDSYYRPDMKSENKSLYIPMYERLKSKNVPLEKMKTILDVGSGEGNNLKFIMEQLPNASYYAIEPSPYCRKVLKAMNVNILGVDAGAEFDQKYRGYFDFIIMRHVLEHFDNPVKVLERIKTLLKEDGVLYIAVPNNLKFGNSKLTEHWFRMVHTYYFNIHSLKNVFKKAGIKVVWMIEGDLYNKKELFTLVKNGKKEKVNVNKENFTIQQQAFDLKLKEEASFINRSKKWLRKQLSKS